jgi:uncharacterized protein YxjI
MKNRIFKITTLLVIMTLILSACGARKTESSSKNLKAYAQVLSSAKEIEIKESLISLGKKYKLYVDGKYVAEVTGKMITVFGDEFKLIDGSGNVLAKEKQIKRWHLKFDRSAAILNPRDNITGYIGEETLTKIFSIGYFFHFFDKDKKEIGTSDQVNISLLKKNVFTNADGTSAYKVSKELTFLTDSYKLKVIDSTKIPLYQAIFMVCIEDAIKDSKEKTKSKSKLKLFKH